MPVAKIAASASGDTTIIAASATRRFKIKKLYFIAKGAVDVKFKSGSTDITGVLGLAAAQEVGITQHSDDDEPILVGGAVNEAFIINLSGAVTVGGFCTYDFVIGG